MKILHITSSLDVGGAQLVLYRLALAQALEHSVQVVSLRDLGDVGVRLISAGVVVECLDLGRSPRSMTGIVKLARILRHDPPDVVQTWMYHADLIGGGVARLCGVRAVVWGVRSGEPNGRGLKLSTAAVIRLCVCAADTVPTTILCCSEVSANVHKQLGYPASRLVVVRNGIDTEEFAPTPSARADARDHLGLRHDVPVVGIVGRWHPQKDYETFCAAAGVIRGALPEVWFVMCGAGLSQANGELKGLLGRFGVADQVLLLGSQRDVAPVLHSLDLCVSSSAFGEGFPNVIGEAMACGVPCVGTAVGDTGVLIRETGRVVTPGRPLELASACIEMLQESATTREALGRAARSRVIKKFSLERMVEGHMRVLQEAVIRSRW